MYKFEILDTNGLARNGVLSTYLGKIKTPAFMPVGTAATVKGMKNHEIEEAGFNLILANTYHLMLRPGAERIKLLGGLNKFMSWNHSILTDSGGFQIMSLGDKVKIDDHGVTFSSHLDGTLYRMTAEDSIKIQHDLNSTITMIFDECIAHPSTFNDTKNSLKRSINWAKRSYDSYKKRKGYGIFGIIQGGMYPELRKKSCEVLKDINFDGYAIGGLAVGEGQKIMFEVLDFTVPYLLADKPRYLMGVGYPLDIIGAVKRGVDMFDCVLPTRSGRTGLAMTWHGPIKIRNAKYASDSNPIDKNCPCPVCKNYSRAYLNHLDKCSEILGCNLITQHNISFYGQLMKKIRMAISNKNLDELENSLM